MVYTGILMETNGISVMVSIGLLLFFFSSLKRVWSVFASLTGQLHVCFAADEQPVSVLRRAVVLARIALVTVAPFLEVPDQERPVIQHGRSGSQRNGNAVPPPGDGDRPLPLYLTVQHEGAVPHRDDITGFFDEGQLWSSAQIWRTRAGERDNEE